MKTKFIEKFRMGKPVEYGERAKYEYLAAPSWDCEWYWGFGYLQNNDIHHHVDGLVRDKNQNQNMYDALRAYYGDTLTITDDKDLWTFCELMQSFYALKETAEVLGHGGPHYTSNPLADVIKNEAEAKRINEIVLPVIFDAVDTLISKYR